MAVTYDLITSKYPPPPPPPKIETPHGARRSVTCAETSLCTGRLPSRWFCSGTSNIFIRGNCINVSCSLEWGKRLYYKEKFKKREQWTEIIWTENLKLYFCLKCKTLIWRKKNKIVRIKKLICHLSRISWVDEHGRKLFHLTSVVFNYRYRLSMNTSVLHHSKLI